MEYYEEGEMNPDLESLAKAAKRTKWSVIILMLAQLYLLAHGRTEHIIGALIYLPLLYLCMKHCYYSTSAYLAGTVLLDIPEEYHYPQSGTKAFLWIAGVLMTMLFYALLASLWTEGLKWVEKPGYAAVSAFLVGALMTPMALVKGCKNSVRKALHDYCIIDIAPDRKKPDHVKVYKWYRDL